MEHLIKRYKASKENIERNPWLKSKIDEYKKLHTAFQIKEARLSPQPPPSFDEERSISTIYWELMLNEHAKAFLESERELIQTAAQKIQEITDACEIDFAFLDDR